MSLANEPLAFAESQPGPDMAWWLVVGLLVVLCLWLRLRRGSKLFTLVRDKRERPAISVIARQADVRLLRIVMDEQEFYFVQSGNGLCQIVRQNVDHVMPTRDVMQ